MWQVAWEQTDTQMNSTTAVTLAHAPWVNDGETSGPFRTGYPSSTPFAIPLSQDALAQILSSQDISTGLSQTSECIVLG